jgi:riboflavin biosynthesis pyrimidine reductase
MTATGADTANLLTTLFDETTARALPLPPGLVARYGGAIGFPDDSGRPYVFANFVSTVDGIVSFALPGRTQARFISKGNESDRFVLAFLRACADAVVVGAGTLREEGGEAAAWTPESVYPDAAPDFLALREALGRRAHPSMVFASGSGSIDLGALPVRPGETVLVLTGEAGASRIGSVPGGVLVRTIAKERPTAAEILAAVVRETGARLVLTEGGPTLFGEFLRGGLVDELFLTIAPQLAGRSNQEPRLGLVEGAAFAPERAPAGRLVSVKRSGDYLFLRFAIAHAREHLERL